ncbi:MAG: serine/threonine-protein kinase [Cyanobacteria bacterium J06638_22]
MSFEPTSSRSCSQGHTNLPGSRFCSICGERLPPAESAPEGELAGRLKDSILANRYRILQLLGSGGFGRTYLAEDLNRFNERCVLKEFAPQVQGEVALQKAQALFEREAGVLYQLRHPQIPRFRELLRTEFEQQAHLFLIQDYVQGKTYKQILESRRRMEKTFSEEEVVHLLRSLLPVLQYIHHQGVIHRDIAPDNLILQSADQRPILIDFGGVKQVAATVASRFGTAPEVTRLGKVGYAPAEQMEDGDVSPQSDLYALGMTAVVLLSGRDPSEFGDIGRGHWKSAIAVHPALMEVLERLLAVDASDRYPSASVALDALKAIPIESSDLNAAPFPPPPPPPSPLSPTTEAAKTQAVSPGSPSIASTRAVPPTPATESRTVARSPLPSPTPQRSNGGNKNIGAIVATAILVGGTLSALWFTSDWWVPLFMGTPNETETSDPNNSAFSPEEQARKDALTARRDDLGVSSRFLVQLADASFFQEYPEMQGNTLSHSPDDAVWRERWDAIALDWLEWMEANLSTQARRQLGDYDSSQRNAWKTEVNQLNVSSRALNDLADAQFFHHFPDWRGEDFIDRPIGQVWQAIAFDQLQALKSGDRLQRVRFGEGEFSRTLDGELAPGSGQVYIAQLSQGQLLRLSLGVPANTTLFSLYLPVPTQELPVLLEDSESTQWSGELPQSGFYEIVVVSRSDASLRYNLSVAADRVTTTPIEPEPLPNNEAEQPIEPDSEAETDEND